MKLNRYMKLILIIYTFINTVTCLFKLISLIMFFRDAFESTRLSCMVLSYSGTIFIINIVQINSISIVRYYMANLAAKAKIAKPGKVLAFISLISFIVVSSQPFAIFVNDTHGFRSSISDCLCLELPKNSYFPLQTFLAMTVMLLMNGFGLYCDIALYIFVKKRNQTHPKAV